MVNVRLDGVGKDAPIPIPKYVEYFIIPMAIYVVTHAVLAIIRACVIHMMDGWYVLTGLASHTIENGKSGQFCQPFQPQEAGIAWTGRSLQRGNSRSGQGNREIEAICD